MIHRFLLLAFLLSTSLNALRAEEDQRIRWAEPSQENWQRLEKQFVTTVSPEKFVFAFEKSPKDPSEAQWKLKWKARKLDAASLTYLGQSQIQYPVYALGKLQLPDGMIGFITGSMIHHKESGQKVWTTDLYLIHKESGGVVLYKNLAQAWRETVSEDGTPNAFTSVKESTLTDMNKDGKLDLIERSTQDGSAHVYPWTDLGFARDRDTQQSPDVVIEAFSRLRKSRPRFP